MNYGAASSFGRTNRLRLGPPFPGTAADNGLSVDGVTGRIVLGSDLGTPIPGQLLSNREIDMNGFNFQMTDGAGGNFLLVDPIAGFYGLGDINGLIGQPALLMDGIAFRVNDTNALQVLEANYFAGLFRFGNIGGQGNGMVTGIIDVTRQFVFQDGLGNRFLEMNATGNQYWIGDINGFNLGTNLEVNDTIGVTTIIANAARGITLNGDTTLMHTLVAFANGAGAAVGTLLNAPVAGNPTKWVPIDDNGTVRYIPTW